MTNRCLTDFRRFKAALLCLILACVAPLGADVKLNGLFSDGMVLQRGQRVAVYGHAARDEKVTVEIAGQSKSALPVPGGRFVVYLDPLDAGGPHELKVSGRNTVVVRDVWVGEVWLASGQSNMDMQVRHCLNAEEEAASADYPLIRQFLVKRGKAAVIQDTLLAADPEQKGRINAWVKCSPGTVGGFSGAAYFFAREIHSRLGVPVGIINSAWGGTNAEAWTCECTMESVPELNSILVDWPAYNNDEQWLREQYAKFLAEKEEAAKTGKPEPLYFNQPAVLFNAMICPLIPYGIQGVLWYQGEGNSHRGYQYRDLFPAMIKNWRYNWERDFPFLFVQLANFEAGSKTWPELREAQLMTMKQLPNMAMTVTTDIGEAEDIHPKNKQEVGRRLSLAARALVYGESGLEWSGPLYRSMRVENGRARLSFEHAGEGLVTRQGESPGGFLIAGEDREFVPAEARIEGAEVVVWSEKVKQPVAVRYGWRDNPEDANLYNRVNWQIGLPASPFRTDEWPGLTANRTW